MSDDDSLYSEEDASVPEESTHDIGDRRSLITVLTGAIIIFIVVLVLLTVRGCGSILNTANRGSATNQIVPVPGRSPVDGSISLWVATGTEVNAALAAASVDHSDIVNMGGGRYVIKVPVGTEAEAARRLREIEGVYDAGRVYATESKTGKP